MTAEKLNRKELGTFGSTFCRMHISSATKTGVNQPEGKVTNNWVNQLLWRTNKPVEKRDTWQLVHVLEEMPNDGIMSSGIWGEVMILTVNDK